MTPPRAGSACFRHARRRTPTNNLDLDTVDQVVEALAAYRGAVLVVSHDDGFLRRIAPDLVLELREGALTEIG